LSATVSWDDDEEDEGFAEQILKVQILLKIQEFSFEQASID
jgi:hypothetical protein